jgi:photosystem II stability/assembly factor-like uncharacterized protein
LAIDPVTPTTVYAGTAYGGAFKSTDGGENWYPVNSGLSSTAEIRALTIDPLVPTTLYAGAWGHGGGVFKSTNGGEGWSPKNTGLTHTNVEALVHD